MLETVSVASDIQMYYVVVILQFCIPSWRSSLLGLIRVQMNTMPMTAMAERMEAKTMMIMCRAAMDNSDEEKDVIFMAFHTDLFCCFRL